MDRIEVQQRREHGYNALVSDNNRQSFIDLPSVRQETLTVSSTMFVSSSSPFPPSVLPPHGIEEIEPLVIVNYGDSVGESLKKQFSTRVANPPISSFCLF